MLSSNAKMVGAERQKAAERGSPHPQQAESAEAVRILELALLLGIAAGEDTRAPVCPCFAQPVAYNIYEQFKVAQLTLL